MFRLGAAVTGADVAIRVPLPQNFGWMYVWDLNPESLDCFASWPLRLGGGVITLAEGSHSWGRLALPLLNYTLASALQLRKNRENRCRGNRA